MKTTEPYIVIVRHGTTRAVWKVPTHARYTSTRTLYNPLHLARRLQVQYNGMHAMFSLD